MGYGRGGGGDFNKPYEVKMNRTIWMREKVRGRDIFTVMFLPLSWIVQ